MLTAQVVGRRRVRLVPATQWEYLYNDVGVSTAVDCENPDYARWPKFRNAMVLNVPLDPGEVLFVPVGWWCHERTLDVSLTVSFTNFVFPNEFAWDMPRIHK